MTQSKLATLFKSRKFWATVFGLATLAVSYQFGHVSAEAAELGAITILSGYVLGTAVEDHGIAMSRATGPTVMLTGLPNVTMATSGSAIVPLAPSSNPGGTT